MNDSLTVAMATAELHPFARVGGLADTVGSLATTLAEQGHRVMAFVPRYSGIDPELLGGFEPIYQLQIPMAGESVEGRVLRGTAPGSPVVTFLIEQPELYDRPGIYADPQTGEAYPDNDRRFTFYCRALVETLRGLGLKPDILHAHDHQAALTLAYLKTIYSEDSGLRHVAGLFTIHNLGYQGIYDRQIMQLTGFPPDSFHPMSPFEFWGKFNFMKAGILFADQISAVSERYAQEIQWSEEFGFGLEGVLRERQRDVIGILNGINTRLWDPQHDGAIRHPYSADDLSGKEENKAALLRELGLDPERRQWPLVGMVSRLVDQKGIDLIVAAAEGLLARDLTLVILGAGQPHYEAFFRELAVRAPDRVAAVIDHDEGLARRIFAGADLVLMPSRYEPCGLTQLYALRYGAIPVVRAIGGLADTVRDYETSNGDGNGFSFMRFEPGEMLVALDRALRVWSDVEARGRLIRNGMDADHSWQQSAQRYVDAYWTTVERKQRVNFRSWSTRKVGKA